PLLFLKPTPTTALYPPPLHAALPISQPAATPAARHRPPAAAAMAAQMAGLASHTADSTHQSGSAGSQVVVSARQPTRNASVPEKDRKSTRLNSSHVAISYAVFCLKKK